jgi:hypothetical protein
MEGTPLSNARDWLLENPTETISAASRIFGVPRPTLQASIRRLTQPPRQQGGLNKVLSATQVEALKKWIIRQYELGLRATRQMTFAAVC